MRKSSLLALVAVVVAVAAPGSAVGRSHGPGGVTIVRVRSAPNGTVLSSGRLNVVAVHPRFAFIVGLRNDEQTRELWVTLRLANSRGVSVYTEQFGTFMRANQRVTVGIRVKQILFAQRQSLELRISDRQHKSVWTAKYPVIFALG
jgi:hypothetical protein